MAAGTIEDQVIPYNPLYRNEDTRKEFIVPITNSDSTNCPIKQCKLAKGSNFDYSNKNVKLEDTGMETWRLDMRQNLNEDGAYQVTGLYFICENNVKTEDFGRTFKVKQNDNPCLTDWSRSNVNKQAVSTVYEYKVATTPLDVFNYETLFSQKDTNSVCELTCELRD
jgi:hypothetical protein